MITSCWRVGGLLGGRTSDSGRHGKAFTRIVEAESASQVA